MDQVVDGRTPRFLWIDHIVLTQYGRLIKPAGIAIYSVLCMHANRNQEAQISLDTICAETGIETRDSALKYLALLEQHGLIAIIRHTDRRGNVYRLLDVVANPGAPRPNKPSERKNGKQPVNQDVDKSAAPVDKSAAIADVADSSPEELSKISTPPVEKFDSSANGTVGIFDSNTPEVSKISTLTRLDARHKQELDVLDDDDAPAREDGRSSSSLSLASLEDQFGPETVQEALAIAAGAGKTGSLRYAAGVLRNWAREGTGPPKSKRINPYASAPDPHRVLREEYGDDVVEDALQAVIAGSWPVEELGNIAADLAGDTARWVETRAGWQREGAP